MIRWGAVTLGLAFAVVSATHAEVGALQTDCKLGGKQDDGSYQFVATCPGRSVSPDGKFVVVQKAYDDDQPPIELQNAHTGRSVTTLRSLSDDMPFSVSWAPNSRWFYVNHHVGSFMDVLQLFQIVGGKAPERRTLVRAAIRQAVHRYPCLPPNMVLPNGTKWSRNGKRIVIVTISRPDVCETWSRRHGTWRSLWMIGDIRTGRIVPGTIRIQADDKPLEMPKDGPYADF